DSDQQAEYKAGFSILTKALQEPLKLIVQNGGQMDAGVVMNEITKNKNVNFGFDASRGEYVSDMIKAGIIDPLKVTRTALESAVSISAILLTTEAAIADKPEEKPSVGMPSMPGGMGGMM
ncbi:MAG: chaperonin GroEL, partial [Patescibacteria group bacterium]|nr:chaperonin GroEL [Patescibacteria group bacterium]